MFAATECDRFGRPVVPKAVRAEVPGPGAYQLPTKLNLVQHKTEVRIPCHSESGGSAPGMRAANNPRGEARAAGRLRVLHVDCGARERRRAARRARPGVLQPITAQQALVPLQHLRAVGLSE
jgi:hypothetical protein